MKGIKKGLHNLFRNEILLIWISIFMAVLSGLLMNHLVTYKYFPHIYFNLNDFEFIIYQIIFLCILSFLFSMVLKLINFKNLKGFWIRLTSCIIIPFLISFLHVIIFYNDKMTELRMNLPDVIEVLSNLSSIIIPIILGLIFINPWKNWLHFVIGILYVAAMYTLQIYFALIVVGIVFDDWL